MALEAAAAPAASTVGVSGGARPPPRDGSPLAGSHARPLSRSGERWALSGSGPPTPPSARSFAAVATASGAAVQLML